MDRSCCRQRGQCCRSYRQEWSSPPVADDQSRQFRGSHVNSGEPLPGRQLRPSFRRTDGPRTAGHRVAGRRLFRAGSCATAPIHCPRPSPPPTTGSPATAWCTASGSERAGPSGTETGGCASAEVAQALGEPVRPGPVHAGMDFAANTNVIGHAGRTFALRGSRSAALRAHLRTGHGRADGLRRHPPRWLYRPPKRDPVTSELHAISYYWGWGNLVQYSVVDGAGRVRKPVNIEVGGPISVHDVTHRTVCRDLRPAGCIRS